MRSIKSLEKGLYILEVIANYPDGARVKDISDEISDPISNMTLFLNSLVLSGFVQKNSNNGKYSIARKVVDIAEKSDKAQFSQLKESASKEMAELSREFNENVLLAVLSGHDIHFIECLQSSRTVQVLQSPDGYYPPHVTAGGKAVLAFRDEEAISVYIENGLYHRFTEKSLVNPKMLREELEHIREAGYAVNRGEYETEIMAVAAPILLESVPQASLVVQFPKFRYTEDDLHNFGERIRKGAQAVADSLAISL